MPTARHATPADRDALAAMLAEAFATDPLWRWLAPDDERWRRRARGMFAHEVAARMRLGHTYTDDGRTGAALWAPPGLWRTPARDVVTAALPTARLLGGRGSRRGMTVLRTLERSHPKGDHWYLAVLGTHPDHQGRGIASALLEPVLDRCDLDGTGAFLESSDPANVTFYERHGFRATGEVRPGGAPPVTLMWRDPRPVGAG